MSDVCPTLNVTLECALSSRPGLPHSSLVPQQTRVFPSEGYFSSSDQYGVSHQHSASPRRLQGSKARAQETAPPIFQHKNTQIPGRLLETSLPSTHRSNNRSGMPLQPNATLHRINMLQRPHWTCTNPHGTPAPSRPNTPCHLTQLMSLTFT